MLIVVNGPSPESARSRFKLVLAGHLPLLPVGASNIAVAASSFIKPKDKTGELWDPLAKDKTRVTVSSADAIGVELEDTAATHELKTTEYNCTACNETVLAADSDGLLGQAPNNQIESCPSCGGHQLTTISSFNALSLMVQKDTEVQKAGNDPDVGTITASEQVSNDSTDRRTAKMKRNKQVLAGDDEATKLGVEDQNDPVTIEDLDGSEAENPEVAEDHDLEDMGNDEDEGDDEGEGDEDGEDSGFDLGDDEDDDEGEDEGDEPESDLDDEEIEDEGEEEDDEGGEHEGDDEESDDRAQVVPSPKATDMGKMGEMSKTKKTTATKLDKGEEGVHPDDRNDQPGLKVKKAETAGTKKTGTKITARAVTKTTVKAKVTTANALASGKRLNIDTPSVLLVSRPSLQRAALAASKFSTKTAMSYATVASSVKSFLNTAGPKQKLRFDVHGLLAGECPLCSYHTIASDSLAAKDIKCQNCGSGIPTLIPAALSADPTELEDHVDIDSPHANHPHDEDGECEDQDDDGEGEEESAYIPAGNTVDPEDGADGQDLGEEDMEDHDGDEENVEANDMDPEECEDTALPENDEGADEVPVDTGKGDTDDEIDDHIEEIDMAQACAIEASDTVSLHYCVNASGNSGSQWMLMVNELPVMTLSRSNVKGEFAALANEHFNNSQFSKKVIAAVLNKKTRAIEVASSIGFTGIKVPAVVDKVVTAKTREHRYQVEAAAAQRVSNYQKSFITVLPVAAAGINRSFFAGKTNPMKTALCSALQKAGVQGAAKIVHKAFAEHASAYNALLIDRAQYLLSKSPETRRELAAAIMGPSYTFAEENQEVTDPNQDQGEDAKPGDVADIEDPNQDQGADEHEDSVESDATVDHAGLDKMLQSADQNGGDQQRPGQQTTASEIDTVTQTRALLRGMLRR